MRISLDRMAEWSHSAGQAGLPELISPRDYSGLNVQDTTLRIWLPEAARVGLEHLCERQETSMTVYLTEYFTTYLYGLHELMRMRESRLGLYAPQVVDESVPKRLACAMATEPEEPPCLGKNIFALKIFVPGKIKDGLRTHALKAQLELGAFTRALICAHLFGREYGPQQLMTWVADEVRQADAWEAATEEGDE